MAQSNFRFTGNPRIAQYQPRGLEYFTFLPKLQAEVRGAAMRKANGLSFDTSGLAPEDLAQVQDRTGFITDSRDKIVDRLLEGDAVTDAVVRDLTKLSRNKTELDSQIGLARQNAQLIRKHHDAMDAYGRQIGNVAYTQKIKEDSMKQWGSTFGADGSVNHYKPANVPGYADPVAKATSLFQVAYQNMTPEERGVINPDDFQVVSVPKTDGSGGTQLVLTYNKPKDLMSNSPALARALEQVNNMFTKKAENAEGLTGTTKEYDFLDYMGDEYTLAVMNEIKTINSIYAREKEVASANVLASGFGSGTNTTGKIVPTRLPNEEFTQYQFAKHGKETITSVTDPESYNIRQRYDDGSSQVVPVIDDKDYNSFNKDNQNQLNFLFGNVNSIEDLGKFIVNDTEEEQKAFVEENNVDYTHQYHDVPLSKAAREIIQEGELGYTSNKHFKQAVQDFISVYKATGQKDFSLNLTKEELLNSTKLSDAKRRLKEAAIDFYNEGVVDNKFRANTNMYVTEVPMKMQYYDSHGARKEVDEYEDIYRKDILDSARNGLVVKYIVDPVTGNFNYGGRSTIKDERGDVVSGVEEILLDKNSTRPTMMGRGFDYSKGIATNPAEAEQINKRMSQGWVFSKINADGDREVYVVQNDLPELKSANKEVLVLDKPEAESGKVDTLENTIINLKPGERTTIAVRNPQNPKAITKFGVEYTGGMYRIGGYDSNNVFRPSNVAGNSPQHLISLVNKYI